MIYKKIFLLLPMIFVGLCVYASEKSNEYKFPAKKKKQRSLVSAVTKPISDATYEKPTVYANDILKYTCQDGIPKVYHTALVMHAATYDASKSALDDALAEVEAKRKSSNYVKEFQDNVRRVMHPNFVALNARAQKNRFQRLADILAIIERDHISLSQHTACVADIHMCMANYAQNVAYASVAKRCMGLLEKHDQQEKALRAIQEVRRAIAALKDAENCEQQQEAENALVVLIGQHNQDPVLRSAAVRGTCALYERAIRIYGALVRQEEEYSVQGKKLRDFCVLQLMDMIDYLHRITDNRTPEDKIMVELEKYADQECKDSTTILFGAFVKNLLKYPDLRAACIRSVRRKYPETENFIKDNRYIFTVQFTKDLYFTMFNPAFVA